ncbi:MAG TPA: Rne/Rng family ribonuclease [Acidobacteriaceae bacterium]|jgi:ribonuclease G|nr:Rne/Rng family ribonuclease [Acidobacteriaceae bacterium]
MTKEIYISSTPHETRLALVEDDRLAEIYYERENEYTLAGSIYKGRVTRVLPGMQSAFVDVGLERDAFLYVTDFAEESEDGEEYVALPPGGPQPEGTRNDRSENRNSNRNESRGGTRGEIQNQAQSSSPEENASEGDAASSEDSGVRRWRGRRGRRRGNDRGADRGNNRNSDRAAAAPPAVILPEETRVPSEETSSESHSERNQELRAPEQSSRQRFSDRRTSDAAPSNAAPLILPGESLSKYRRGNEPAPTPSSASAPAASRQPAAAASTARPSTLVEAPLSWDGGLQLPGESISRLRKPAKIAEQTATPIPADTEAAPISHAPISQIAEPAIESESVAENATPAESGIAQHPIAEPEAITPEPVAPAAEYEPTAASASYLVDPATPSAYRLGGVAEPEPIAKSPVPVAESPVVEEFAAEPKASVYEESVPSAREEEVSVPAPHVPSFATNETDIEVSEADSDEATTDEEESDEESNDASIRAFAPGTGVLEEELIDEDEAEFSPSYALLEDNEFDELVEETLDVQMDSGLISDMVRDAHIEERTRFNEEQNGQTLEESDDLDEEDDLSEEEDFASDESLESDESDDDAVAEESSEEGTQQDGAARPARQRFAGRGRGRQNNRRRTGGSGGQGRRATAQTTNMPAINDLLKSGQEILVQIAKEPIARKGARITSHIALPGRFLVFMPTVNHVGVSRKISSDEERQRLKRILISEKGDAGGGFIVRTAAATASEEDLRADIRFLLSLWADIRSRSEASKPPALIYHDLSLVERILRDQVSENFSTIWVDTEADYERVLRFLQRFQPSLVRRVKLYTKETPLFEQFGIQDEINTALRSKVWLKSGGSIVINQTEALVAIDINTGKYVGKTARLEDTILKTNLDAIPEMVRQIRLRDLGGIIVIDFIDMDERKNRHRVMQALEDELHNDRAPSKVLQFNDFGLVAITRKRVKQSLERTLSTQCTICTGTGMVKSPVTVCNEIYIELRKMHRHLEKGDVMLRVHPEVVKQLKSSNARWLGEMEELSGKTIIVKSDPSLHPEQFDIH